MAEKPLCTIGKIAEQTGCNIETIRYFENIGLLAKPSRSKGGFRLYGETQFMQLNFIQKMRELGFAQSDIKVFLELAHQQGDANDDLKAMVQDQLEGIAQKIEDLKKLYNTFSMIWDQCECSCDDLCSQIMLCFNCNPDSDR